MLGTSPLDNLDRDIYIATASHDEECAGQVITWVTHASLVPEKRNVVAVFSKFNHTYKVLSASGVFALNLPSREQTAVAVRFGLYTGNEIRKFDNPGVKIRTVADVPVLCETAGYSVVTVMSQVDLGDRMVVIARVIEEKFFSEVPPLKLSHFLKSCSEDEIALQRSNYLKMVERDAGLISDEL
jgi:flavin reductase (DIM6/NTAB) family NADH-FMN oxidoreductase RutF